MSQIQTFPFVKNQFDQIRSCVFGRNWPVVYLIENKQEIYVGETINVYSRSKQHYDRPERAKLKRIHVISDEEYNKSATLDIESLLIQHFAADGKFIIQNSNHGLFDHNYYDKQKYRAKFEIIWQELQKMLLAEKSLVQIKNSDLFKFSPYKALTEDQLKIENQLIDEIKNSLAKTFIVHGGPGTGKTIVAMHLFKLFSDLKETKNKKAALVIPMTSLRRSLKKVFKNIAGLRSDMVIGPSEVVGGRYDILVVDEAHRLRKRKNITNYRSFDKNNQVLGLGKNGTELDWIIKSSSHQILFYDERQSVRPSDVNGGKFLELGAMEFRLKNQLRIDVGEESEKYIDFIQNLFDLNSTGKSEFLEYDFKIYDNIAKMRDDIKSKDRKLGLCRMISGYAWPWVSKKNPDKHDIEINGIKLFWNSVNHNWVNSANAINEVGCIHTVQGYDLNYAGVIIGPELSYDKKNKKFVIHPENYKDVNGRKGIDNPKELEAYIINIYRTLLTRGMKGTYLFIVDQELRKYFKSMIKNK